MEGPLARELRDFVRDKVTRDERCEWCGSEVTTVGPRGGRKWEFAHYENCLFLRIWHALNERGL